MKEDFSQRLLRVFLIGVPCFVIGMFVCSTMLANTRSESIYCITMLFVGGVSGVIAWLLSGLVRRQRFVHVPRYDDEETRFDEEEKPKRG